MWITLILLLGLLLLASAFFSGTETAFFALNRVQLRRMEREGSRRSRRVLQTLTRPADLLTTVLVANTLVNVAISVVLTTLLIRLLGARGGEAAAVAIATVTVLLVGEITPKTLAVNFPEVVSRVAVDPYSVFRVVLGPLVAAVSFLSDIFLRALGLNPLLMGPSRVFTRTELGSLLEGADEEGVMTARESRLVQNILEFSSTTVEEVMTPRVDMVAAPENLEQDRLEALVAEAKHSRIPIYRRTIDEVTGYLPVRDFLLYPERRLRELIRPVMVFPERAPAARVFYEIQKNRTPMVIVVNEYGETVGLLTREDLLEEVVGDIYDEYERGQAPIRRIGPNLYLADGQANLEELSEAIGIGIPSEDAVTLNGFLTGLHGGIPRRGEMIRWNGVEFTALEVSRHRIQRCQVRIDERPGEETGRSDQRPGGGSPWA